MDKERIALVTGGMGGLGEAICRRLHKAGYKVATSYSPGNEQAAAWLQSQEQAGYRFPAYQIDVADYVSCEAAVHRIIAEVGQIDVLVNNAGITRDKMLRKMNVHDWQAVVHTNLDSVFNMSRPILDGMIERGWGRIINISSVNGQKGAPGQTNYAAAKAGMHGFTKALALEVAKKGITVNTVSPGYLRTKMVMKVPYDVLEKNVLPGIPMGRLGEPDEIAALVAFLASEDAGYITGANIAINGGQHMC